MNIEPFVIRATELTRGMMERTKRIPDFADFRAAFEDVLKKERSVILKEEIEERAFNDVEHEA